MWQPIATAPFDGDLELAVVDQNGVHTLVFPCRRVDHAWIKVQGERLIEVHPTHWRPWAETKQA
jgi:hypothetical protein